MPPPAARSQLFCCQKAHKIVIVLAPVVKQWDGAGFSRWQKWSAQRGRGAGGPFVPGFSESPYYNFRPQPAIPASGSSGAQEGRGFVKKHLLACPCGAEIAVSGGQAGGQVVCTTCQAVVNVPKLRELGRLPLAQEAAAGPRRGWGPAQGMLLAGGLVALASWGAAAWLGRTIESPVDVEAIRQNVAMQTDAQIYEAWRNHFSTTTVSRPQMVVEKLFAQQTFLRQGMAFALAGLGAVGAIVGVAGGIGVIRRRPAA